MNWRSTSTRIYLLLVLIMIVLVVLETVLPLNINQGQQMSWMTVVIAALLGGVGLVLSPKTGFPSLWDDNISNQQRFWKPLLIGGVLGLSLIHI